VFFRVTAKLNHGKAPAFLEKLRDGTIRKQKPDGQEIFDSMNRAVVLESGQILWDEMCFCPTPLAHERSTVYDEHFDDMTAKEIAERQQYKGQPFMEFLEETASG